MATVTLVANTDYSDLTVADDDTIDLAGYTLTLNVNPAQTGVHVVTPGTAGKVVLGVPADYPLIGWTLTAGTGQLIASVPSGKSLGGLLVGGSASGAYAVFVNSGTLTGGTKGGSVNGADGCYVNDGLISGSIEGGSSNGAHGLNINRSTVTGTIKGGGVSGAFGVSQNSGPLLGGAINGVEVAISQVRSNVLLINGPSWTSTIPAAVKVLYSLFGAVNPLVTVPGGTQVIILSGNAALAMRLGNRLAQRGAYQ